MPVHVLHALVEAPALPARAASCAEYGQSNLFERMLSGTLMSMPPTASISVMNDAKSTITTWLTCRPGRRAASAVWIASFGPPICIAALIFCSP